MILLDKANKYAEDVKSGKEITTWEVRKEVDNYYKNLEAQDKDDFSYYLDIKKLKIINNLLKLLFFADGIGVTGKSALEGITGFQAFLLVNIFGWRFKSNPLKFKNRDIVLYIARKNAKTWIVAIIFILLMLTEPNYSEFYSICMSKDLAAEVRKAIVKTIESSPAINKHFKISKTFTGRIECLLTHSFFQPRVAEAGKNNSIKPNAFVSDEHAFFTSKDNYNAMRSGQRNVINPITFITTTAYAESNSIMNDDLHYIREILRGNITNDRMFALIFYAEKEHLWDDTGLYQANPLRIEDNYQEIRDSREKAMIITDEKEEYITKSMNVMLETNEDDHYIDMDIWKKGRVKHIDFTGKHIVVGVDMSSTGDLTAVGAMFIEEETIYCNSHGFLPEIGLEKRRESFNYIESERRNECTIMKGVREIQYDKVEEYIRSLETERGAIIDCIVVDPKFAQDLTNNLERDYEIVKCSQTYTCLSGATKDFRRKSNNNKVVYEANELLDWNMSNAITEKGKADDEMIAKFNKFKNKVRIDLVAVLVFAYTELVVEEDTSYDAIDALENANWD